MYCDDRDDGEDELIKEKRTYQINEINQVRKKSATGREKKGIYKKKNEKRGIESNRTRLSAVLYNKY